MFHKVTIVINYLGKKYVCCQEQLGKVKVKKLKKCFTRSSLLTEFQQMILLKFVIPSVIVLLTTLETSSNQFHLAALTIRIREILTFFFRNVNKTEILESIMRLKEEGDINEISQKLLVMCKNHVAYHLKELLKFCITSGVYPNIFEIAHITHIHKKGSSHDYSNYRPVSVLSNLYKVFETLYTIVFKISVKHPNFCSKLIWCL